VAWPGLRRAAVAVVEGGGERVVALLADQELSGSGDGFVVVGAGFGGGDELAGVGVEVGVLGPDRPVAGVVGGLRQRAESHIPARGLSACGVPASLRHSARTGR
jgi:hypothetical protein